MVWFAFSVQPAILHTRITNIIERSRYEMVPHL